MEHGDRADVADLFLKKGGNERKEKRWFYTASLVEATVKKLIINHRSHKASLEVFRKPHMLLYY